MVCLHQIYCFWKTVSYKLISQINLGISLQGCNRSCKSISTTGLATQGEKYVRTSRLCVIYSYAPAGWPGSEESAGACYLREEVTLFSYGRIDDNENR
jgi:hypothetical protein